MGSIDGKVDDEKYYIIDNLRAQYREVVSAIRGKDNKLACEQIDSLRCALFQYREQHRVNYKEDLFKDPVSAGYYDGFSRLLKALDLYSQNGHVIIKEETLKRFEILFSGVLEGIKKQINLHLKSIENRSKSE